jgi:drug/metabolite transporter (DMT)-like permease
VNQPTKARIWVFVAVVFWGLSFVATKTALRELSPTTLIFLRFAFGVVLLLLILRLRGRKTLPPADAIPDLLLMGFVGVFVHQMLQSFGLTKATAVHTGWLIGIVPLWSALFSAIFIGEKFGWMKITGLAGGFCGALLVISQGRFSSDMLRLPSTRGDLLILLSTINWAVYSVLGHKTIKRLGALSATSGALLMGTLMLAPLFLWNAGWRELRMLSPQGWGALLFLGIGCSGLGYLFWYGALERIEVSRVSAFLYIEPFVTLLAAVVLLGEPVHAVTVGGGLLVLGSVYLLQRAPDEKRKE